MQPLAPIVLFVFRRPEHTLKTLEALANNILADDSILYIYADGLKKDADQETIELVEETRAILKQKQWCKEVHIIEAEENKGLANSIVEGVTDIVNKYGEIIVLEDDIVTSPYFLQYMNDALNIYENEDKVMHISGYLPRTTEREKLPETFFVRYMYCWGWATWKRAWDNLIVDTEYLYKALQEREDFSHFNLGGAINSFSQIEKNLDGSLKTWAIKWYSTIFLNDGLCLTPRNSLVDNIGIDGTGENSFSNDDRWRIDKFDGSVKIERENSISENEEAVAYLVRFNKYGSDSSSLNVYLQKIKQMKYLSFSEIYNISIQKISAILKR